MALTPVDILRFADSSGDTSGATTADGTSGLPYWSWALTNVRRFSIRIPRGFIAGSAISLEIAESTPGVSLRHKWQAVVSLVEPDVDATNVSAGATYTSEVVSSSTANQLTDRSITITTSGQIGSTNPAADDILSVVLSRVAASAAEDGNDIKLFQLSVLFDLDTAAISGCTGRVGAIMDAVSIAFNDEKLGHVSAAQLLGWINECQQDIAEAGFWKKQTIIDADTTTIDLITEISDFVDIEDVQFRTSSTATPYYLVPIDNKARYNYLLNCSATGSPEGYLIENNQLYLWPVPTATVTDGLLIDHTYAQDDLGCSSSTTPHWPKPHDLVMKYYCLWRGHMRDRNAPGATDRAKDYEFLYRKAKAALLASGDSGVMIVKGPR